MTRRDAALLSLTLAGLYCLYTAVMLSFTLVAVLSMPPESVMASGNRTVQRLLTVMPLLILTCSGVALLQSRRKFATWVFGANPSHDATAQIDAGDVRLLAVRVLGLLSFTQLVQQLPTLRAFAAADSRPLLNVSLAGIALLAIAALLCFIRGGTVVRWLFAAGPGEGKSARYRDGLSFALAVIAAWYVISSAGAVVSGIAEAMLLSYDGIAARALAFLISSGSALAMCVIGIGVFFSRRRLAGSNA
jgi:hypothetical protein